MQNNESSKVIAAVSSSSKTPDGDEVHGVETDLLRKKGAEEGAQMDVSDIKSALLSTNEAKEEDAQVDESNTETDPLLKAPATRQSSIEIRMTESPTDPTVESRCISDGIQQTILIEKPPFEFIHSSGKSLLNLTSIHRDSTISFIGVLTLKW